MEDLKNYKPYRTLKISMVGDQPTPKKGINSSRAVYNALKDEISVLDREHFYVVCLSVKNKIIGINLVTIGTLTAAMVHPREVFKVAILANSASIVLVHNHPSGDPEPSPADTDITKRLVEGGKLLGINVFDHVIIGGGRYYSYTDNGAL